MDFLVYYGEKFLLMLGLFVVFAALVTSGVYLIICFIAGLGEGD